MIDTLSTRQAAARLKSYTPEAAWAIVEYYEQMEQDTGTPIEFDDDAIRGDWSEYADLSEWARENKRIIADYHDDFDSLMNDLEPEERDDALKETLMRSCDTFIILDNGVILTGLF
jgi:hypothetical protein